MGFAFISYSRQDTKIVDDIATRLQGDGLDVWIDRVNIKGGELWTVEIVEAIDTADSFVLMLSPHSTASDNVRKEVQLAQDANRKLFPLLLAAVKLPPQFRYQLAGIQIIDYAGNPQEKYDELVEVLRANRKEIVPVPEERTVEAVLGNEKLPQFNSGKEKKLVQTISNVSETPPDTIEITKLKDGSVHAFIRMPTHAAYVLKTAALNRDKRLLKHGIDALRLNGEENYIHVATGEISPLDLPKPKPPIIKGILSILITATVLGGGLLATLPKIQQVINPPTSTSTQTLTKTPTLTPSPTRTGTPTQTRTITPIPPTKTFTPTSTPTTPPSQPKLVKPLHGDHVSCDGPVTLIWNPAYDTDGIAEYEVNLSINNNGQGSNIFFQKVDGKTTQLDISNEVLKNCNQWLQWSVHAMDQTGLWGDWAEGVVFFTENTPPPAPMIDVDPKQGNGNVSCYATPKLFWNEPYDSNGIIGYQVVIDVYNNGSGQWENIINETTASNSFDISFLPSKFCNQWIRAQVEAQDGLGAWGSWSSWLQFLLELPTPG